MYNVGDIVKFPNGELRKCIASSEDFYKDLKPCPFCGAKIDGSYIEDILAPMYGSSINIFCPSCKTVFMLEYQNATETWNNRVPDIGDKKDVKE